MKSWPRRGEARQVQDLLRERVRVEPLPIGNVHRVAGVDASYQGKSVCASVVVLEFPELQTIEQAVVEVPITFPYVPGLLSFREGPAIQAAVEKFFCRNLLAGRISWQLRDVNNDNWRIY